MLRKKTLKTYECTYLLAIRKGWTGDWRKLTPGEGPKKEVHPAVHYRT